MKCRVTLIVAHGPDGAIGLQGKLPWPTHCEDMRRFREATLGNPVIMGRKTWDSLKEGLPYRHNIVVTSNPRSIDRSKADAVTSVQEALKVAGRGEIFIIGGAKLFASSLGFCDRFLITEMKSRFAGDVYFKVPFLSDKTLVSREEWEDSDPRLNCTFFEYHTAR